MEGIGVMRRLDRDRDFGTVVKVENAAAMRLLRSLQHSFKLGCRWVILEVSRGGYLEKWKTFHAYSPAHCHILENQEQGPGKIIKTISHVTKLLNGTPLSILRPDQVRAFQKRMDEQYFIHLDDDIIGSQSFLLHDYFPMNWLIKVRLSDICTSYSLAFEVTTEKDTHLSVQLTPTSFSSLGEVLIWMKSVLHTIPDLTVEPKTIQVFGELTAGTGKLLGENGRVLLYKLPILRNSLLDMNNMLQIHDPYDPITLKVTLILRNNSTANATFCYNESLKRIPFGFNSAPGTKLLWDLQPIFFIRYKR